VKGTQMARHFCGMSMRMILCFHLFCAVGLWADEAGDRAVINKVIAAVNDPAQRPGLFTKGVDSDVDFDRLVDLHTECPSSSGAMRGTQRAFSIGMDETWRVLTVPRVVIGSVRFMKRDAAIVDGASTIRGATTLAESVPLLFVLKKKGAEWRISAVRASGGNEVIAETIAPGNERRAVLFESGCGATTYFSTHLSILDRNEALPRGSGNVFIADSDHRKIGMNVHMYWKSRDHLVVSFPAGARVFLRSTSSQGVHVSYQAYALK
jgi:hypothetical protein